VNENDIIRVSEGDTAIIDVDSYSYSGKKFKGVVTSIANTANDKASPDAVTEFEVKIIILNESYKDLQDQGIKYPFRPGMTASVDIITEVKYDVLSVPLAAVTTRKPGNNKEKDEGVENEEGSETSDQESSVKAAEVKEDEEVVFINDNGIARKIKVKTGISDYDNIEILEGLEMGQEVVVGPFLVISKRLEGDEHIKAMGSNGKDEEAQTASTE
jgi:HlyD family secretion protein